MEYFEFIKRDFQELEYKCYFCKGYLYLMGTRGLNHCTSDEIIVNLRKKKFAIKGENLEIKELSKNEIRVKGNILMLCIVD